MPTSAAWVTSALYQALMRVAGNVGKPEVPSSGKALSGFSLAGETGTLAVTYQGTEAPASTLKMIPRQWPRVSFERDGVFHAKTLQAKCAPSTRPSPSQRMTRPLPLLPCVTTVTRAAGTFQLRSMPQIQQPFPPSSPNRTASLLTHSTPTSKPPAARPLPSQRLSSGSTKLPKVFRPIRRATRHQLRSACGQALRHRRRKRRGQIDSAAHPRRVEHSHFRHS